MQGCICWRDIQSSYLEELGVAVDAGHTLPHNPWLPQVPLIRDQQVQCAVLVLRQRACRKETSSARLQEPLTTMCQQFLGGLHCVCFAYVFTDGTKFTTFGQNMCCRCDVTIASKWLVRFTRQAAKHMMSARPPSAKHKQHTKMVVAEEDGELHRLQRLVQLRQPVVRQLAGRQEVLRSEAVTEFKRSCKTFAGQARPELLQQMTCNALDAASCQVHLYELSLVQLGWILWPHWRAGG